MAFPENIKWGFWDKLPLFYHFLHLASLPNTESHHHPLIYPSNPITQLHSCNMRTRDLRRYRLRFVPLLDAGGHFPFTQVTVVQLSTVDQDVTVDQLLNILPPFHISSPHHILLIRISLKDRESHYGGFGIW